MLAHAPPDKECQALCRTAVGCLPALKPAQAKLGIDVDALKPLNCLDRTQRGGSPRQRQFQLNAKFDSVAFEPAPTPNRSTYVGSKVHASTPSPVAWSVSEVVDRPLAAQQLPHIGHSLPPPVACLPRRWGFAVDRGQFSTQSAPEFQWTAIESAVKQKGGGCAWVDRPVELRETGARKRAPRTATIAGEAVL